MSSVDNRVVDMKFNNGDFASKVSATLGLLAKLKGALKMDGAAKGLDEVTAAGRRFNLNGMGAGIDAVKAKFSALQVMGVTALATITHQAMAAGTNLVKSFTLTPITDGFREYETKMGSIQTILANTSRYGTKLSDVNAALEDLNKYADKTIYNFGDMTRNIGLFTNAGIRLEDATSMIKGFSNAAAASGTNAQQAAGAAYQLSQSLSSGKITLETWRSLTNASMGNKNMQQGLIDIASAMDTFRGTGAKATDAQKDFNKSLEKGWLAPDVMSKYLKIMAGDMSNAEMKSMGLSAATIKTFNEQQKTAEEAATKVRTFTQLMGTLKEAVGSGWAETFGIVFGNFDQATELFSGISDVIGGFVNKSSEARNKLLHDWAELGGRVALIDGLKIAFQGLMTIIKPIKDAFRQIFPPVTAQQLYNLTEQFFNFADSIKIGETTAKNLKRTFAGVFAIFSIIGQVLGGAIGFITSFFGAIGEGTGGLLNFTGGIGDFLVSLDKMLKKTGIIKTFFNGLGKILQVPLKLIGKLGKLIGNAFNGVKMPDLSSIFDGLGAGTSGLSAIGTKITGFFNSLWKKIKSFGAKVREALSGVGEVISDVFSDMDFSRVLAVINTGLLGGIVLLLKNFFSGKGFSLNIGSGFFDAVTDTLGAVTDKMKIMQTEVKANIILKIAGALGILAASMVLISTIDGEDLAKSLAGLAGGLAVLQGGLMALSSQIGFFDSLKLPVLTASLLALAGAMILMAGAIKIMGSIPGDQIVKGLFTIGASLLVIAGAMRLMPKNMVGQALAIGLLAVSLTALAGAIKLFSKIDWDEMGKGLAGIAASLLVIAGAMRLMPKDMLAQSVALVAVAGALTLIGDAVEDMGDMSWEEIGKGLTTLGGSLGLLAAGLNLMNGTLPGSAALIVAAGAIMLLVPALMAFSSMSWEEIGKGMVTLGGSLLLLAGGLYIMTGTIAGSAALVIAVGALNLLVPVLMALGSMSWESIAKGLLALAGSFTILGVAGMLLTPLAPTLLALGAAMLMIGAGFALAGAGALAFSAAIYVLVAAISLAVNTIMGVLKTLATMSAQAMTTMVNAVIAGAAALARGGPQFTAAMTTIIRSILQAVTNNIPRIGALFLTLITTALRVLVAAVPRIAAAGLQIISRLLSVINQNVPRIVPIAMSIITRFINGIAQRIGSVVNAAVNLITQFLSGINKQMPRLAQAGAQTVISFVNAVAGAIRANSGQMGAAAANLGTAIIEGIARAIAGGVGTVISAAKRMAQSALSAAKGALGIHSPSREFAKVGKFAVEGFAKGLTGNKDQVTAAYNTMKDLLSTAMKEAGKDVDSLEAKLKKLNKARKKDKDAIKETKKALAQARVEQEKSKNALHALTVHLDDDRDKLKKLADQHTKMADRIKAATDKLKDATKTRDDYKKSVTDQYSDLPDVTKETKLSDYVSGLQKQIIDTQQFSTAIQKLRDLGLNDAMYKDLISKGPDALPFVQELLARGKNGVDEINTLDSALSKAAGGLGSKASQELYQAAVDSAAGLVKGLQNQQKNIEKQMDKIADYMTKAIKKRLGIHSPSREFAKIGGWSIQGLVRGLVDSSKDSQKAAASVGDDTLGALKKSISGLAGVTGSGIDLNPTITPVLDLTSVRKAATGLGGLLPNQNISVATAYSRAVDTSRGYSANLNDVSTAVKTAALRENITFIQNNNSPKHLSNAEIYRQTRNQLSLAKGALR